MGDVTRILTAIEQGEPRAAEDLLPLVYDELRKLASHRMAREQPDHTLQPTALVHEAYLRLVDDFEPGWWDALHSVKKRLLRERLRATIDPDPIAPTLRPDALLLADWGPLGESPISRLRSSKIPVPERPPDQYPQEVWDELARQKRLIAASDGTYELPPE